MSLLRAVFAPGPRALCMATAVAAGLGLASPARAADDPAPAHRQPELRFGVLEIRVPGRRQRFAAFEQERRNVMRIAGGEFRRKADEAVEVSASANRHDFDG